jgi:hypothetical protein
METDYGLIALEATMFETAVTRMLGIERPIIGGTTCFFLFNLCP